MTKAKDTPAAIALTLHAHLPYVVNHGTWPHGLEWLHEAAAETYLPLLRMLPISSATPSPRTSISICRQSCSSNSPTRSSSPSSPATSSARSSPPGKMKPTSSRPAKPPHRNRPLLAPLLLTAPTISTRSTATSSPPSATSRHRQIELLTCCATHGYIPLLGTDESLRAQIRTAVYTHTRHLGQRPAASGRRMRLPPCRPLGVSRHRPPAHPAPSPASTASASSRHSPNPPRLLLRRHPPHRRHRPSPRPTSPNTALRAPQAEPPNAPHATSTSPTLSTAPTTNASPPPSSRAIPSTGLQVWSGDTGYPGDANYLDFHKKRFPGGHRYWQVTGAGVDIGDKLALLPAAGRRPRPRTRQPLRLPRLRDPLLRLRRLHPARPQLALRRRALRPLVVRGSHLAGGRLPHSARAHHRHRHHHLQPISRALSPRRLHRDAGRLLGSRRPPSGLAQPGNLMDLDPHLPCRTLRP